MCRNWNSPPLKQIDVTDTGTSQSERPLIHQHPSQRQTKEDLCYLSTFTEFIATHIMEILLVPSFNSIWYLLCTKFQQSYLDCLFFFLWHTKDQQRSTYVIHSHLPDSWVYPAMRFARACYRGPRSFLFFFVSFCSVFFYPELNCLNTQKWKEKNFQVHSFMAMTMHQCHFISEKSTDNCRMVRDAQILWRQ